MNMVDGSTLLIEIFVFIRQRGYGHVPLLPGLSVIFTGSEMFTLLVY
jgi:hypothetical protein